MNHVGRKRIMIFTIATVLLFLVQNAAADDNFSPACNNPQYMVMPQYIPASGSIFANVPSVTLYTNTMLDAIYSSDILRQVFDLSRLPVKQTNDFAITYTRNFLPSLGLENADELAKFMFRGVEPNFKVLTLPIVARVYANSAANALFTDGLLQMQNAEYLALEYVREMVASANMSLNSDPFSRPKVIADGFVNYFTSLGMTTKEKAPIVVYYVGNEWFVAAANYRWF